MRNMDTPTTTHTPDRPVVIEPGPTPTSISLAIADNGVRKYIVLSTHTATGMGVYYLEPDVVRRLIPAMERALQGASTSLHMPAGSIL